MALLSALILAKSESKRLPNKNTLPINGVPMFVINLRKCLKIFDKVYVSSDNLEILDRAMKEGAIPIKRPKSLCGDTPNIDVYRHALKFIDGDIVAVQANSPTIDKILIKNVKKIMELGVEEIMTCHTGGKIYGSIWGITRERIKNYKDPFKPDPQLLIFDNSIDIHTQQDYNEAIKYYE